MRHHIARQLLGTICERGAHDWPVAATTLYAVRCTAEGRDPILGAAFDRLAASSSAETLKPAPCSEPLLDSADATAQQLTDIVTRHPCWIGSELARIAATVGLWGHATRGERMQLRRLWFAGLSERQPPTDAVASRAQLCTWQSRLATVFTDEPPTVDNLSGLLQAADAEEAYRQIASHLCADLDIQQLASVLGVLAQQVLLRHFDRQGQTHTAYLGAVALSHLAGRIEPDTALVAACQLAHQIWWCSGRRTTRSLRRGSTGFGLDLKAAVRAGDYTAAQRAARQLAVEPVRFWNDSRVLVQEAIEQGLDEWPRALMALITASCRCDQQCLAPDDAATLAASLAAIHWLSQPATV